jgi:hypothetical protein
MKIWNLKMEQIKKRRSLSQVKEVKEVKEARAIFNIARLSYK